MNHLKIFLSVITIFLFSTQVQGAWRSVLPKIVPPVLAAGFATKEYFDQKKMQKFDNHEAAYKACLFTIELFNGAAVSQDDKEAFATFQQKFAEHKKKLSDPAIDVQILPTDMGMSSPGYFVKVAPHDYVIHLEWLHLDFLKKHFDASMLHELGHIEEHDDEKNSRELIIQKGLYGGVAGSIALTPHLRLRNRLMLLPIALLGTKEVTTFVRNKLNQQREYRADLFAARHSSGDQTISMLEAASLLLDKIIKKEELDKWIDVVRYNDLFGTHPSCEKRIAAVKKYMEEQKKGM